MEERWAQGGNTTWIRHHFHAIQTPCKAWGNNLFTYWHVLKMGGNQRAQKKPIGKKSGAQDRTQDPLELLGH